MCTVKMQKIKIIIYGKWTEVTNIKNYKIFIDRIETKV